MVSSHPKLNVPKLLILGAIAYYAWRHMQLKKAGELSGAPWRVSINPEMVAGAVTPLLGINNPYVAMKTQQVIANAFRRVQL
jgi:hypothetical protein